MKWLFISIATLATSLLIGHSVAAQSAYDDIVQPAEDIGVMYYTSPPFTTVEYNSYFTNWTALFEDLEPALYQEFQDALDYWDYENYAIVSGYWSNDPGFTDPWNFSVIWLNTDPYCTLNTNNWTPYELQIRSNHSSCLKYVQFSAGGSGSTSVTTSTGSSQNRTIAYYYPYSGLYGVKPFVNTFPIQYPAGYEGQEVPEVAPGGDPQRTPRATLAVNDKDLTIDFESAGGVNDYIYSWHLSRYVPSSGLDPQTLEPVEAGFDMPGNAHSTYLEHRGNYALSIRMCAADHDQEIPECTSLENTRAAWLDIFADGSYFSISTGGNMDSEDLQNCITDDLGGQSTTRCQAKLMDDCALDGDTMLDKIGQIPGLITCQLRNYFSGVRSLAMFLMIPSSHQLQQTINNFLDNVKAQLGFVYESFGILIDGIGDIIVAAGTANCVLPLGTWYGDDLELSLCEVRSMFGETAWNLAMLLIRGGIAFGFVFSSYRYLQAFFADRRASL